jgi:hypothetical protein
MKLPVIRKLSSGKYMIGFDTRINKTICTRHPLSISKKKTFDREPNVADPGIVRWITYGGSAQLLLLKQLVAVALLI